MFDLDIIEKDWKNNSFCLSNLEIMNIYKDEGITKTNYKNEIDEFLKSLPRMTYEERLRAHILGDKDMQAKYEKIFEQKKQMMENWPKRKYLSHESQMKVVEGCMDVVFKQTRYWYSIFDKKIPMEELYNICLDSLFNSAKYCLHYSTKPSFRLYVEQSIFRNIVKKISKLNHISYLEALEIIDNITNSNEVKENNLKNFEYENEILYKPSCIYELIKNDSYDIDYIRRISSDEFMTDYQQAIDELPYEERAIMTLLYDSNGNDGFTYNEISEFFGYEPKKIGNVKARVKKKLRKDHRFDKYKTE